MKPMTLYRQRYVPFETVALKDDIILYRDEDKIITKWKVFRPKAQFSHGVSCYFFKEGYKVSKFLNDEEKLVYYYCDIIETTVKDDTYIFTDLLVDVIVYETGFVKVVDLAELADALEEGIIDAAVVQKALRQLEKLLEIIYGGGFSKLTDNLEIEGTL